jgi:hypothetical protein
MGGVNSIPHDPNILDQIKNKDYSVVSINKRDEAQNNKEGNISVWELKNIRTLSGTGACTPLPRSIFLKPGNTINKNVFISQVKGQYIRLYADRRCRIRANEEEYAALNPPRENLFSPNYNGKDTDFAIVPYQRYQNAHFYRITDQPMNVPRLPQFYIKPKAANYDPNLYSNKQFVEYEDTEPAVCREIPKNIPEDFPDYSLDYHFLSKETDGGVGIERGVDRFPDAKNTRTNATKYIPITIFSDVLKDSKNDIIRDENDNPTCANIYTPSIYYGGDKLKDGAHKPPTSSQQVRYTPIPYTKVHNYGTNIAHKTNSMYYELKGQPGILD